MSQLTVNLTKVEESKKSLMLSLQKAGVGTLSPSEVETVMDVSGSFFDEHRDQITTALMIRLFPWAMTFDPDRKMGMTTFSSGHGSVHRCPDVTIDNLENYIHRHVFEKVPGWNGATEYHRVLESVLTDSGWINNEAQAEKKAGFFGRMLGQKDQPAREASQKKRTLVLFITDGDNSDKQHTLNALKASQQRGDEVYFLFIGVRQNAGDRFHFLESIGDEFDNTGFYMVENLRQFIQWDDEKLNSHLISDEMVRWFNR
ncbi:VWA domain-containing protein [Jeongeupia wiesaeckerbachi]|uniref:VWA domain-containing protein n=1 Tax=Jeongeupia wiesaeckerbachi TaxID=3051218 RepID=UPI003D807F65